MTIEHAPAPHRPYPVRVSADLDPHLSRGLWLVKWLLAIPHYLVLWALWVAFGVSSITAFFAIVFTGRFPRGLFDFNVGVLRWTWRVTFYAYGALGTDRYPPFTLAEVPDYPARLEVDYPERLSRKLVLVKWWLLALPHYLVVGFFLSGGILAAGQATDHPQPFVLGGGLIGLLVLIAALALLFTGRYPRPVFDLVVGLQRWVLRVAAYAALMTDEYPPFRLDQGGAADQSANQVTPPAAGDPPPSSTSLVSPTRSATTRAKVVMVAGVTSLVVAAVLAISASGLWTARKTLPDRDGFFTAPTASCRVDTYAITSEPMRLHFDGIAGLTPHSVLGDGRATVRSVDGSSVFLGIAETDAVETYLQGVARSTMRPERQLGERRLPICESFDGQPPPAEPAAFPIWKTYAEGPGTQRITWPFREGDWTVVVMNADRSQNLSVEVDAGATFPGIGLVISAAMLATAFFLILGLAMVIGSAAASRSMRHVEATQSPSA